MWGNRASVVLIAVLIATLLGSCAPVAAPPAQTVVQTVVVEKEVPVDKQTVILSYNRFFNLSFGDGPSPLEVIRQEVAKKYPEIDVQLNLAPDDMNQWHDALAIWITAKDSTIDLYGMDLPWVTEFATAGWAVPLNDHLPNVNENIEQAGLDLYSYDGTIYGIPFWTGAIGLYYRTDLLEEYGFEPPQTWDELVEIATTITADKPEMTGYLWAGSKAESLTMVWAEFLHAFGGTYWDEQGQCLFNSPEGIAAVEFMKSTIDSGLSPAETVSWTNEEARTRFVEGNAVFLRGPHDYITWLNDPAQSSVVDKWDFIANPAQPGGIHAGASGGFALAVSPYTDNLDAALKVMEVITSEEVQKGFAIAWGPVQYYKGLYDDPDVQKVYPEAYRLSNVLSSALARPPHPAYAQLSSIIQDEVHSAITGIKPVKQALDDACAQYELIQ